MLKAILLLFFLNIFIPAKTFAGSGNFPIGGRPAALANAYVAVTDLYAAHHNQAALGFVENAGFGVFSENKFLVEGLNKFGMVVAIPTTTGTFGLDATYFGYELYNETKIGIGFGKKLTNKFALGLQFDYFNTSIAEYGKASAFTFEVGIYYKLSNKLSIGAHIFNPIQSKVGELEESLPAILRIGAAYEASKSVLLVLEAEKDIYFNPVFKGGIEYILSEHLHLRAGTSSSPALLSFGIGIFVKSLVIDISSIYHQTLGFSPSAGVSYVFKK